jgi:hypothetical protein
LSTFFEHFSIGFDLSLAQLFHRFTFVPCLSVKGFIDDIEDGVKVEVAEIGIHDQLKQGVLHLCFVGQWLFLPVEKRLHLCEDVLQKGVFCL